MNVATIHVKTQAKLQMLLSGCSDIENASEGSMGKGKRLLIKNKRYELEEEKEESDLTFFSRSQAPSWDSSSDDDITPAFEMPKPQFLSKFWDVPSQGPVLAATIGGSSVVDSVRRILRKLFTTELALRINFSGVKGKIGFQRLQLRAVLLDCSKVPFQGSDRSRG